MYFEEELKKFDDKVIKSIGVVICDVDGLKLVNDTLGHLWIKHLKQGIL